EQFGNDGRDQPIGSHYRHFEDDGTCALGIDEDGVVTIGEAIEEIDQSETTIRSVEQKLLQLIPIVVRDDDVEIRNSGMRDDLVEVDQFCREQLVHPTRSGLDQLIVGREGRLGIQVYEEDS